MILDRLEDRGHQPTRLILPDPLAGRFHEIDPFEDPVLGLGSEPLEPGDFAALSGGAG